MYQYLEISRNFVQSKLRPPLLEAGLIFKGEQGNTVRLYNTGTEEDSHHGVGILIDVNRKATEKNRR